MILHTDIWACSCPECYVKKKLPFSFKRYKYQLIWALGVGIKNHPSPYSPTQYHFNLGHSIFIWIPFNFVMIEKKKQ